MKLNRLQFAVARAYAQLAERPLAQAQLEPDIVRYRELELGPPQGELFPEEEEDGHGQKAETRRHSKL